MTAFHGSWPGDVCVLIVDDDDEQRLAVRAALERAGHVVIEASNGREALTLCRTQRPSIVLLDVVMPVMDGASFLRVKNRDDEIARIPVVMMTAWDVGSVFGVRSILRKPASSHSIVDAVRSFAMLSSAELR